MRLFCWRIMDILMWCMGFFPISFGFSLGWTNLFHYWNNEGIALDDTKISVQCSSINSSECLSTISHMRALCSYAVKLPNHFYFVRVRVFSHKVALFISDYFLKTPSKFRASRAFLCKTDQRHILKTTYKENWCWKSQSYVCFNLILKLLNSCRFYHKRREDWICPCQIWLSKLSFQFELSTMSELCTMTLGNDWGKEKKKRN